MLKPYHKHYFTPWSEVLKSQRSKLLHDIKNKRKTKLKSSKLKINSQSHLPQRKSFESL